MGSSESIYFETPQSVLQAGDLRRGGKNRSSSAARVCTCGRAKKHLLNDFTVLPAVNTNLPLERTSSFPCTKEERLRCFPPKRNQSGCFPSPGLGNFDASFSATIEYGTLVHWVARFIELRVQTWGSRSLCLVAIIRVRRFSHEVPKLIPSSRPYLSICYHLIYHLFLGHCLYQLMRIH